MANMRLGTMGSMALALAMLLAVSCKKEGERKSGSTDTSSSSVQESGGQEPGFTRAEIRRETPLQIDTTGLAKPAPKAAEPAAAAASAPAKPVDPPKPEPVAPVAAPSPAAPVAKPEPPSASGAVVPNETGEWVLQVNVHKSEPEAKAQIAKLGQMGIPAYAVPVPTGDANLSGNYWRVRVGRFTTRTDAQTYGKSILEPKGLKFWIDRKSNESRQGA